MAAHPQSKRAKKRKGQRKSTQPTEKAAASPPSKAAKPDRPMSARAMRKRRNRRQEIALGGAVAVAIVAFAWFGLRPGPELPGVERPPNDGRGHVAGATFGDSTPTSGQHNRSAPACGLYQSPLALDLAVHALEHGVVVYWYDATRPELAEDLMQSLSDFDSHVIVSPNADLSAPVVATAWNRRLPLQGGGDEATAFASTYRKRGPEQVACDVST